MVRPWALADSTFAFIYLDECLLLADGTYILCSPMRWWVMYYGVAFRSMLMIHSSIWEKTYLFLYWEYIYFGQIILKNRVLGEWLLLWCRAEANLSFHRCALYNKKCLSPFAAIFLQIELAFPVRRYLVLCWMEEFSDSWSSFEGRLSRHASPVGPKCTLASVSSACFSLRWLLSGKLCLLTFKCRLAESFKLTLACALDLAALENIPSLSFRIV